MGHALLNATFFRLIGERMADRVLLVMGKRDGAYVAGALNFIGGDTLYGRYWGCLETQHFLHFEACYYQAIEYAIANEIAHVEAGAQGEQSLRAATSLRRLTASIISPIRASPRRSRAICGRSGGWLRRSKRSWSGALPYKRCP